MDWELCCITQVSGYIGRRIGCLSCDNGSVSGYHMGCDSMDILGDIIFATVDECVCLA